MKKHPRRQLFDQMATSAFQHKRAVTKLVARFRELPFRDMMSGRPIDDRYDYLKNDEDDTFERDLAIGNNIPPTSPAGDRSPSPDNARRVRAETVESASSAVVSVADLLMLKNTPPGASGDGMMGNPVRHRRRDLTNAEMEELQKKILAGSRRPGLAMDEPAEVEDPAGKIGAGGGVASRPSTASETTGTATTTNTRPASGASGRASAGAAALALSSANLVVSRQPSTVSPPPRQASISNPLSRQPSSTAMRSPSVGAAPSGGILRESTSAGSTNTSRPTRSSRVNFAEETGSPRPPEGAADGVDVAPVAASAEWEGDGGAQVDGDGVEHGDDSSGGAKVGAFGTPEVDISEDEYRDGEEDDMVGGLNGGERDVLPEFVDADGVSVDGSLGLTSGTDQSLEAGTESAEGVVPKPPMRDWKSRVSSGLSRRISSAGSRGRTGSVVRQERASLKVKVMRAVGPQIPKAVVPLSMGDVLSSEDVKVTSPTNLWRLQWQCGYVV
ncbi:hypothetical protein HK101_004985 [Irineochytrium annulatum]|nr:hypothetical protein HK101_004985 [Irineochytrium annulatum]